MKEQNHLFLDVLNGKKVDRPPVWMMRQAGRYLPEYMELRRKYDFFTRVETPELAAEITIQPIDIIKPDAAILFSDILVIPKAMGMDVQLVDKVGPFFPKTIENKQDVDNLNTDEAPERLQHVYDAIKITQEKLDGRVPLIGFAGAPWTVFCYMIEGKGSKNFAKAKTFCYQHPELAESVLDKVTDVTISYLKNKVAAGAQAIQIFDSWASLLNQKDYAKYSQKYIDRITEAISPLAPVIIYLRGNPFAYANYKDSSCSAIGVDWGISPTIAKQLVGDKKVIQGNFDPIKLLMPIDELKKETISMLDEFGTQKYVANLGHGILPNIPVDHAKAFVDTVKSYSYK